MVKQNGIFIGLGSNLGDRELEIDRALKLLFSFDVEVLKRSSLYTTPPWGVLEQPIFLNMVAEVQYSGSPWELLEIVLEVEKNMGRERLQNWGPRLIDIDILSFSTEEIRSQRLTIPHPYLAERAFVLVPWSEIAPDFLVPGHGKCIAELTADLPENERDEVKPYRAQ